MQNILKLNKEDKIEVRFDDRWFEYIVLAVEENGIWGNPVYNGKRHFAKDWIPYYHHYGLNKGQLRIRKI